MVREVWSYRELVVAYTRAQYRLRYRQSFIGLLWAVVPPLATLGVAVLVFHGVANIQARDVPYPILALSAVAPWSFFASALMFGVPSVATAQPLVTKMAFPRAVLPLSAIGISLLDFAVVCAMYVVFAIAYRHGLAATAAWFPILLVIEIVLVTGIVLLGSALNTFARDVRLIVPLAVQLWLFVTPVMYPLGSVPPRLRGLYLLNPMSGLVESFRRVLAFGQPPTLGLLVPAVVSAAVAFAIGFWYFGATEKRFADVI